MILLKLTSAKHYISRCTHKFSLQLLPLFPCIFDNLSLAVVMILLLQLASLLFVLNLLIEFFHWPHTASNHDGCEE
jgi:hypothetical protein